MSDRKLAGRITVDRANKRLLIDGVEFPWLITSDGPQIGDVCGKDTLPTCTVSIFADDIEVIPERGTEG